MTTEMITDLVRLTLFTALKISAPLLIIAMVVGFAISIFQSVTQINEMTLTFVPKILVFAVALSSAFPWILKTIIAFTKHILITQWDNVTSFTSYTN